MKKSETETTPDAGDEHLALLRRQVAAQELANSLAEQQLRLARDQAGRANDTAHARMEEKMQLVEQERLAIIEYRTEGGGEVRTPLRASVQTDAGTLSVRFVAVSTREHSDTPRRKGETNPRGKQRITRIEGWDPREAEAAIRASIYEQYQSTMDELERMAQHAALAGFKDRLEVGSSGAGGVVTVPGVRQTVYSQVTIPIWERVIGHLLEDLLASGAVQRIEQPEQPAAA